MTHFDHLVVSTYSKRLASRALWTVFPRSIYIVEFEH